MVEKEEVGMDPLILSTQKMCGAHEVEFPIPLKICK